MIVATAGHIDHGKTLLVKALTGVDADRLPEEKRRGMTIDLGFAYLPIAGAGIVGFVDVPGHERFVRNMLAGATGVNAALVVVAADDGPMPQTREHLAILDLLGIEVGAAVLTKIDRVDLPRQAAAQAEVRRALAGTAFATAPIFPVSALTGDGLPALQAWLAAEARVARARATEGGFRLAIDRAFLLPGPGLVVTGTVAAGQVQAGAHLVLTPPGLPVRVRGIRAQDRAVGAATAGDRAALNIVGQGLSRDMVARGQWLVDPGLHAPTDRIDTLVRLLPAAERELRTGTRVHLHIGAAAIMASVAPLAERKLPAGQQGLVQLVTAEPIGALAGDRFVLRDEDARVTIGGGRVIDPWAPARGRSRPERLAFLSADQARAPDAALAALLEAAPDGLPLTPFARRRNRDLTEVRRLAEGMGAHVVGADPVAVSDAAWRRLLGEVLDAAGRVAGASPGRGTITPADLARGLGRRLPAPILGAAVDTLVADAKLERVGPDVRLPGQRASLSTADQALWQRLEPLLAEARPAATPDLAKRLSVDARRVELLVRRMLATGRLVRISDRRVIARARLIDLAQLAEALAAEPFGLQPGAFRDRSGLGRNFAIEVLEYFDRIGFTRRQGEGRRVLKRAADALAPQREAG